MVAAEANWYWVAEVAVDRCLQTRVAAAENFLEVSEVLLLAAVAGLLDGDEKAVAALRHRAVVE